MPNTINILCSDGQVELIRSSWTESVDFSVILKDVSKKEKKRKYIFDSDEKKLKIDGLDREGRYLIKIQNHTPYRRLFNRANTKYITAKLKSKILITGSGRCGTTSIANYLNGLQFKNGDYIFSSHETLFEYILPLIINQRPDEIKGLFNKLINDIESAHYYSMLDLEGFHTAKTIHIIRDGRKVVQSGYNRGWYQSDTIWEKIKPGFSGDLFTKCCKFWAYMVNCAGNKADTYYRMEDLTASDATRMDLLNFLNIRKTGRKFPLSNTNKIVSNTEDWTTKQKETFEIHCSELMDRYYPGWKHNF